MIIPVRRRTLRANRQAAPRQTPAAGAQAGVRIAGGRTPVRLELSVRGLLAGPTSIVREDRLLVGQISGVYLYPTAIDTRFVVTRAAVMVGP